MATRTTAGRSIRAVSRRRRDDDPLDELYAAPLREFVPRRKAIVTRLREQGRSDDARAVAEVAKPKATVWAINRVARTSPKDVKRIIVTFDALKAAQLRTPAKMDTAAREFRAATEAAVHAAIEALKASDVGVTLDTHRRIANTLRGAAASARGALVDGRLVDEVAPGGFDLFGGAMPRGRRPRLRVVEPKPEPAPPPPRDDVARRRAAELEEEAAGHERAARSASAALQEARERLRELEAQARASVRTATKSRGVADRAKRRAEKRPRRRRR